MLPDRFWEKVDKNSDQGCWEWIAGPYDQTMPGTFRLGSRSPHAHRLAYEDQVGELVPGQVVYRKCENPRCVNPEHLEQITLTETRRRQHYGHGFLPQVQR